MFHKFSKLVFVTTFVFGCTLGKDQKESPKRILQEYVSRSFAIKNFSEKTKLVELTTGEVKQTLESLDIEAFKQHFIAQRREFLSLRIRDERKVGDERYSITYELSYLSKTSESENKITNKKHAIFIYEQGQWLIAEVRNLKTLIEHRHDISF